MNFDSVPAWSFGLKGKGGNDGLDVPGPGQYKPNQDYWKKDLTFGKSPRGRSQGDDGDVGPGKYNTNLSSFGKQGARIIGTRNYPHK